MISTTNFASGPSAMVSLERVTNEPNLLNGIKLMLAVQFLRKKDSCFENPQIRTINTAVSSPTMGVS